MKQMTKTALALVVALSAGYGVYTSQQKSKLSELALANVEALADDGENPMCENGCLDNGDGCLCHYWFPTYREANL